MVRAVFPISVAAVCLVGMTACQSPGSSTVRNSAHDTDAPACMLSDELLAARKKEFQELTRAIVERRKIHDGLAFRFEPKPGVVSRLAKLVDLERDCCQFISFRIIVEDHNGPVWLELSAPEPARERIEEYFGSSLG